MLTKVLEPLRWFAFIGLCRRERAAESRRLPSYRDALKGVSAFLATSLIMAVLSVSQLAAAQTTKLHEQTTAQGETLRTPYITHLEFENIMIDGKARLGALLTVTSIDEVTRMLGEPKSTEAVEINAGSYKAEVSLIYDGMEATYLEAARKIRLKEFRITSPDRFVRIGEKQVRPGMDARELSTAVYNDYKKSAQKPSNKSSNAYIAVAEEGAKSGGEMRFDHYTDIEIKFDEETGEVTRFHIFRVI